MRLTISLLAAIGLHGALFGAAAFLWHLPTKAQAPPAVELDVELVAPPKPDPIADSPPAAKPTSAPSRPRVARHLREVALVARSTPVSAIAEPSTDVDAPTISAAAPAVSPSSGAATAVRASAPAAQGGGAVISAKPRYHSNPKPDYPIPSLRRGEEGIVLLDVQVQADGTPAAISLNRSCGHPLLDRAALEAVRRWTFEPARAAGVPVSSLVVIPVRFSLDDR